MSYIPLEISYDEITAWYGLNYIVTLLVLRNILHFLMKKRCIP